MTTTTTRQNRRIVGFVTGVLVGVLTVAGNALAGSVEPDDGGYVPGGYVTTTTSAHPSLDVGAFSPVCVRDAPYISYTIVPRGFTPTDESAQLVFIDRNGDTVETRVVDGLSGVTVYPGASVDANGDATDWPGWTRAADGSWTLDPTDATLRDGLVIEVTVDGVSATTEVDYPAAGTPCNGPHVQEQCVPGQDGDGTPDDDCALASTGSNGGDILLIGAATLLVGFALVTGVRRGQQRPAWPPPATG